MRVGADKRQGVFGFMTLKDVQIDEFLPLPTGKDGMSHRHFICLWT